MRAHDLDRIARLPRVELACRAVARRIVAGMALVAVRHHLEQRWSAAGTCAIDRAPPSLDDFEEILPVDAFARHTVRGCTFGETFDRIGIFDGCAHAVLVVLDDENDRQLPNR